MQTSEMTPRQRMSAAINHQAPDRLPLDIWATGEVWSKLRGHFGADADLDAILHLDRFGSTGPAYSGPTPTTADPDHPTNFWGMKHRRVSYGSGTYLEQVHFPLAEARTIDDLEAYRWPSADWFDYSPIKSRAAEQHDTRLVQCGYMAIFYYHNQLRGLEQSLMDPHDDPDFTHHLLRRLSDFFVDHHRRIFEAADGLIDVAQVTDDYGSQDGPMIGLPTFREFYLPHVQRLIHLCRQFGIKVLHHDDGAMSGFLPDLVAAGIDILNPIQWRCPGMDPAALKKQWGDRICFHGGVDNQQTLPHGSPDDVRREVRWLIDTLASDQTGYILAPCHNLQAVTPVENIIAMYDEAWNYGRF